MSMNNDLINELWVKYHILPDDTIQFLKYRQIGRRKAIEFLNTKLRKIIQNQFQSNEYDEYEELKILRAKVLDDINKELKKHPLNWR